MSTTALHVTVITGASRGLGFCMASQLLARGQRLLTLQRQPNPALQGDVEQWAVDLAEPQPVGARLGQWVASLPRARLASLTLINNAALLVRPGPMRDADALEVSRALRASLEAPLLLTASFLHASQDVKAPRKVLNISSGLGRFAMAGSAVYCAAKAGMDHFSRALALEEAEKPGGARVVSLAPGVIDTDMQVQLRGADPAAFTAQSRFQTMKDSGGLDSSEAAAAKVLAFLDRPDFGADPIGDVRDTR